jgi:predicted amidohydrolase YtcJ
MVVQNSVSHVILFHNGTILTLEQSRPRAEALLVRDGAVAEVGGPSMVDAAGEDVTTVDLAGATVVPGFVDAHNHFSFTAFEPEMIDCSTPPLASLSEVFEQIADHCSRAPAGAWVRGWGFHASQISEGRNPTRRELDEVAPRNPFVLLDVSFHACYANSAALGESGISRDTRDPRVGSIERDQNGEPTGTLLEAAMDPLQRISWLDYLNRDPALSLELVERQCHRFLALGITTVCDALVLPEAAALYDRAQQESRLKLSVSQLHGGEGFFAPPNPDRVSTDPDAGDRRALSGGMLKVFMDPSYPSPAIDRASGCGCMERLGASCYAPEEIKDLATSAAKRGLGLAVHCGGNRAVEQALDAFEAVRAAPGNGSLTLRIEHSFIGARGQARRFAELGVQLVTQPGLAAEYGHFFAGMRGDDRENLVLFPVRSMLDAGVAVAASSDYPCGGGLDPLAIMSAAVERRRADGVPIDPEEAVDREAALRMFTQWAAAACGRWPIEGSLAPGKRANLVVLDRDPLRCDPATVSVEQTWVDGELRWSA